MRDRYTITERLDHGGMAEVFRGVAESMEGFKKSVAIKRILPNLTKNQKFVSIELYQGESKDVAKNRKLGQIVLDDLPPGPDGLSERAVKFIRRDLARRNGGGRGEAAARPSPPFPLCRRAARAGSLRPQAVFDSYSRAANTK